MCSAGASFLMFPFASRSAASLRRTAARVVSLAACFAIGDVFRLAAVEGSAPSRQSKKAAKFFNTLNYSRVDSGDSSMISKLDRISTVGRSVAATLQYFVSESSIAWATAFAETDRPVMM